MKESRSTDSWSSFFHFNHLAPLPFAARITQLLLALPISLFSFCTAYPTLWLSADDVLDELEIVIGGEEHPVNMIWISDSDSDSDSDPGANAGGAELKSESDSDSFSEPGDDAGNGVLEPFAAALQELYGSDTDSASNNRSISDFAATIEKGIEDLF
ncbi:unnamed protein product [Linum trigynum]|uniref:Uncharacterized protein n=1 Tax=Linum trigynum TaxID=586398 RepID=A0AAV2DC52_9ROSI